jgi:hypothetical protein
MKLYVTGCARTGTTLLGRLFYAFEDVTVIDPEIDIGSFSNASGISTPHYSGKRSVGTVFSNLLSVNAIGQQLHIIESQDIKVINIVRDGRDVCYRPEKGTVCRPERWLESMEQQEKYKDYIAYTVFYEDLFTRADIVQGGIERLFDLTVISNWSKYPDFVPDSAFETQSTQGLPSYGRRKLELSRHDPDAWTDWLDMSQMKDQNTYEKMLNWIERYEKREIS